jgi:adenylate cyclase
VLPFANMSGDPEQEYFSDGITEDIITDLSKVSALAVIARNTSFTFKSKAVDVVQLCRQLGATHVLEGSVRKAGNRVRITAQLIDGAAGDHCWAERWDRDLGDIFALQDEISMAVVAAVRLKLLPEEKKAIRQRGTNSSDAYNLYLMARQQYASGNQGDPRRDEAIVRLCSKAVEIDPNYARAWAMIGLSQTSLHFRFGRPGTNGLEAAERALELDPELAEPHTVKARQLYELGRRDEAIREVETALALDPESYEVNLGAGYLCFREHRYAEATEHYQRAAAIMGSDYHSAGTLLSCYLAVGDSAGAERAARMALSRAELALAQDQNNGSAIGFAVVALAVLDEMQRAREWIDRAILLDPDNMNMRYNFACALLLRSGEKEAAMDLIEPVISSTTETWLNHIELDPDLDPLRGESRFQTMLAAARSRVTEPAE